MKGLLTYAWHLLIFGVAILSQDASEKGINMLGEVVVEIVKRPAGEAPEGIRDAWIGLQMPGIFLEETPTGAVGVVTHRLSHNTGASYAIRWANATAALQRAGKEEAFRWWRERMVDPHDRLIFRADECRVLTEA